MLLRYSTRIAIHVQGNLISLPTDSDSLSAIDTGTTLVGGPPQAISNIYAQIPGALPATGNFDGYYMYRKCLISCCHRELRHCSAACSTPVNITLSFGGRDWPISSADFRLTQLSPTTCLGAFFELSEGGSAPAWIVGDTFLVSLFAISARNLHQLMPH